MDVRASANPVLASARRWLARVNARHPWSHNEHFHGWILRNLPVRRRAAVDVGCGTGVLAGKLAPHFARVTGIGADASMAAAASARLAYDRGGTIGRCGFEHFAAAARAHLPGATLRRSLFFRSTLRWDKPPVTAPPPAPATPGAR